MEFMADQTKQIEAEILEFIKEVDRRYELMVTDKNRIMKENVAFKNW